jgi:hypothetical protein
VHRRKSSQGAPLLIRLKMTFRCPRRAGPRRQKKGQHRVMQTSSPYGVISEIVKGRFRQVKQGGKEAQRPPSIQNLPHAVFIQLDSKVHIPPSFLLCVPNYPQQAGRPPTNSFSLVLAKRSRNRLNQPLDIEGLVATYFAGFVLKVMRHS